MPFTIEFLRYKTDQISNRRSNKTDIKYIYYVSIIWDISKMRMPTFQIFLSFLTLFLCTVMAQAQDENDYDETMEG